MRLGQTLRIGGRLALVPGVLAGMAFGNSLSYYYGYSSVSFGVQQSSDPFSTQNVTYAPQVSMVSANQSQAYDYGYSAQAAATTTYGSFGVLASTYGYSAPATAAAPTYNYSAQSTYTSWGTVSNTAAANTVSFSSWNAAAGTSGMVTSSYSAPSSGFNTGYSGSFGGWNSFASYTNSSAPAPSVYAIVYSDYNPMNSFNSTGWQAVNMAVIPRVANQISTPTPTPSASPTPKTPTVNLGPGTGIAVGTPEPGTWFSMSAGLALILLKLRRKQQ